MLTNFVSQVHRCARGILQPQKPRHARKGDATPWPNPSSPPLPTYRPDTVFEHSDSRLPRTIGFHDSFSQALMPLLAEHFRRITFTRQYAMDKMLAEQEKPDVVIQEMVDRIFMGPAEMFQQPRTSRPIAREWSVLPLVPHAGTCIIPRPEIR